MNIAINGPCPSVDTQGSKIRAPATEREQATSIRAEERRPAMRTTESSADPCMPVPCRIAVTRAGPGRASETAGPDKRVAPPSLGILVKVARRILGDEIQAWDAVQEVLISFWLHGESLQNPRGWLIRAVTFRSLHLARSRGRRQRHEREACQRRPEASLRDEPTRQFEHAELTQIVAETLRTIPPDQREVIVLRIEEHMDYAAIAETVGIPIGTVRSRLSRTRQAVRNALKRKSMLEEPLDSSLRGKS
jgi:RNA polymerase sigma-70 factor (ECF subfamily)